MSGRQGSSYGPQGAQSPSSRKTGQQVTTEVQLVRISLHLLKGQSRRVNQAFKNGSQHFPTLAGIKGLYDFILSTELNLQIGGNHRTRFQLGTRTFTFF